MTRDEAETEEGLNTTTPTTTPAAAIATTTLPPPPPSEGGWTLGVGRFYFDGSYKLGRSIRFVGTSRTQHFNAIVIASGRFNASTTPDISGLSQWGGLFL
ncbi:hypothetical protein C8J55DRAFT_564661 [Lentinula edodes]|uniref:Uncharacterized protein n=1 Tax=Lentinula lateritia TaxID=40482 RepID=A0A9W8ZX37_9AGAR|nr:hypothetical protein C8J55DRAFT_564661 [Lentinula edodes]